MPAAALNLSLCDLSNAQEAWFSYDLNRKTPECMCIRGGALYIEKNVTRFLTSAHSFSLRKSLTVNYDKFSVFSFVKLELQYSTRQLEKSCLRKP
jgi:hypothetical protein